MKVLVTGHAAGPTKGSSSAPQHDADITVHIGSEEPPTFHDSAIAGDRKVTLAETGLETGTGRRLLRVRLRRLGHVPVHLASSPSSTGCGRRARLPGRSGRAEA